jgi:Skp family chaperone for outer membrane proteins
VAGGGKTWRVSPPREKLGSRQRNVATVKEDTFLQQGVLTVKARRLFSRLLTRVALTSLVLMAGMSGLAHAQGPGAPPPNDGVRVIDVKYILDHHTRFQAAMKNLKKDFEATTRRLQEEKEKIIDREKRLSDYVPGSPEYKQLDESIAQSKADLSLWADKQRKEIRSRESEILWNVYYEIQTAVKTYCERSGVGMVIQYNGEPIDPRKPTAVAQGIARPIVYVAQNRDITPIILDMCVRGAPQVNPDGRQGVPLPDGTR